MFSLSTIPGILSTRPENVVTGEARAQPAPSTVCVGACEQRGAAPQTRERIAASMPKDNVKHPQNTPSSEEKEQSLDLVMLYEKYKRPIHTYVYRLLNSQEDADDVTQEVFIRAFVSWNDLHDHENLSPWLYRIATNLCVDLLRRRKRISWWPLSRRRTGDQQSEVEEDASYLPTDSGGIPEIFEREHIRLALANMPEDYAIVLILSAAQGVPYQDIATIVGISPNAAATRISRAKRMFIEQYRHLNEEDATKREEEL